MVRNGVISGRKTQEGSAGIEPLRRPSTPPPPGGYMEDREDGKNVTCKYRITATIKADTNYELEVIKANLIRAGANILRIDPITIVAEERPDPPKHAA
jgi:hypothetical protein